MTFESLQNLIKDKGIAGCGGAGFPAYAKLSKDADTIILNCAECEPLFKAHRQLLEHKCFEICSALDIITKACDAKEFIIAVKGDYKDTVEAVESVLSQYENGKLSLLPSVYPAGDEVITIYEATGRVVPPGNIPISVGVIVFNVETVYNIYKAIHYGRAVTHKFVTVAGEVREPQTFYVPLGTTYEYLIEMSGGCIRDDVSIISGGPMTGTLSSKQDVVRKNTNGILVLPNDNPVVVKRNAKTRISVMRARSACCQCRSCTDLCPRNLLGHPIDPSEFMKSVSTGTYNNVGKLLDAMYCVSCGICEMYACPQGLNPRSLIAEFKSDMISNGVKPKMHNEATEVNEYREYRKVPMKRLKKRLGLSKYDIEAPISENEVNPKRIKVMLSQHIGVPAKSLVFVGDRVKKGDVIASAAEKGLSLALHCPMDGMVLSANDKFIIIDRD